MNTQCKQCREKFEDFILGLLSPEENKNLEAHLASCRDCKKELEKEKRFLELFRSMGTKPAPGILRQRVLDFAQKQQEKKEGWMGRLSAILTWPRLRILTGAAALALLVFWCVQIARAPRLLEKPPARVSQDKDSDSLPSSMEAPIEESNELRSKKSAPETRASEMDFLQHKPFSSPSSPEISKKKVFKGGAAEGETSFYANSASSNLKGAIQEIRREEKDMKMNDTALNFIQDKGKSGYIDITERLKDFGAVQVSQQVMDEESKTNRYAFALPNSEVERFKKEIENTNIRIVNIRPIPIADTVLGAKQDNFTEIRQTKKADTYYTQQPASPYAFSAAKSTVDTSAPKPATQQLLAKEAQTQLYDTPRDAPASQAAPISPTPSPLGITNGVLSEMPQEQQKQIDFIPQQPAQSVGYIQGEKAPNKAGKMGDFSAIDLRKKEWFADDLSSPTRFQSQQRIIRNRLTTEESLVYVEIEVEPDK